MDHIQLLWLSVLQGITEFLPVSSSGHLILFSKFTDFSDQGIDIDVALHIGSILAVILYFSPTLWEMAKGLWKTKLLPDFQVYGTKVFYLLAIATLPIIGCGLMLKLCGTEWLRNTKLIGWNILLYGLLLWVVDWISLTARKIKHLEVTDALLIGFAQCLSLFPGTSRSGITITMCRFLGMERREAAKFAMLLSIPAILAAGFFSVYLLWEEGNVEKIFDAVHAIGYSFVVSLASIFVLMFWLKNRGFLPFVLYRIVLGTVLLLDAYGIYDIKSLIVQ